MNLLKIKVEKNPLLFSAIFLVMLCALTPIQARAQPYVPIDALQGTYLNTYGMNTAIATGAHTSKEVGQVPGIFPLSPGAAASLAPTSHDFIARQISSGILGMVTSNMIRWIDSGFAGGPAFVTDPNNFFLGIADSVAGGFIYGAGLESFLCSPFKTPEFGFDLKNLLYFKYKNQFEPSTSRWSCTLSGALQNAESYANFTKPGGFSVGGWDGWFQIIQPQNNPYGAYSATEAELNSRIASAQNTELMKLNWGDGFFSLTDDVGNIITPGKTIANSLDTVLGTELRELETADSFDRILQSLSSQLITSVLNSASLRGAAQARADEKVPTRQYAPLTPENLKALDTTWTTIRLGWDPAVGQIGTINYRVWRNDVSVVTTTETVFTDVGLFPNTEYTYQVSAFNDLGQESSRSTSIATSTLPL